MQTRKQRSWTIAILVVMIAAAVGFTAYATKDQWDPSASDSQSYGDSTQNSGTNNGQGDTAYNDNGQFPTRGQSAGAGNAAAAPSVGSAAAAPTTVITPSETAATAITSTATTVAPAVANVAAASEPVTASDPISTSKPLAASQPLVTSKPATLDTFDLPNGAITSQPAVVGANGALLLDAPRGKLVAALTTGTLLEALAGTSDQGWIKVQGGDNSAQSGWIAAGQLLLADPTTLPVQGQASSPVTATVPTSGALLQEAQTGNSLAAPALSSQPQAAVASTSAATAPTLQATIASGSNRLNVRSAPTTGAAIIAGAINGEEYTVVGRNSDGTWLEINTTTGSAASSGVADGWVAAAYVTVTGDLNSVPVVGS